MKRLLYLFALMTMTWGCGLEKEQQGYAFYLGTYTDGDSKGIYQGFLNADGTMDSLNLVAETENPSFLSFAHHQKYLLAVGEVDVEGTGTVESYQVVDKGLKRLSSSISGGAHPCHLSVNETGDVLMANYSGGNVGWVKIDEQGVLSDLLYTAQHHGSSITSRQAAPHAHSIWFMDKSHAVAVDLGIDQLLFYQLNDNQLLQTDSLMLEAGAGPRHLAIHPNKEVLYVINELNSTVSVVAKAEGDWKLLSSISTLPDDYSNDSYCADIHISNDGRFLYASNRGHNSIAIYQIEEEGKNLKLIGHESVNGDWPRNFALTPDEHFLVVANQRSNNLVVFKRDEASGLLSFKSEIEASSPVCVLMGRLVGRLLG
ncbi:lactonase family protein [Carboxylicivirga sp. A043]|uniref:lactonase family protein n=1 Tax=Carboxylicivirga litoralis TaxID=2816963 RepID=UPI0021CB7BCE|nr:lactonase family protein [Carboxylicivirga sp. A043]MCU4155571.1 lactonase family protein [Carboxylicivirga sp. A043]